MVLPQPAGIPALPQRRADVAALVRRLQAEAEQAEAAEALWNIYDSSTDAAKPGIEEALVAADGIPALLQLMGSQRDSCGAGYAASLLHEVTLQSPARCSDILAADGIPPLVSCVEGSSLPRVQANAAAILGNVAFAAVHFGGAGADAVAAAAVPAALQRLGSSQNEHVLMSVAYLLMNAASSHERVAAIGAAGAIPPLLRLMRHDSPDAASEAGLALSNLAHTDSNIGVMVAEGGIPVFVGLLAASEDPDVVEAAGQPICSFLFARHLSLGPQVIAAGGIPALVRCLQGTHFTDLSHEHAAKSLGILAGTGPQASGAIAEAGGADALVQALGRPCSLKAKEAFAFAVLNLLQGGQAAAVAAADPTDATAAALRIMPTSQLLSNDFQTLASVTVARMHLAEARRNMAALAAAAAPAGSAAQPPPVCAGPGCGATTGLRRCTGCYSVLYCSRECTKAHWQCHRAECRRMQAERAAGE